MNAIASASLWQPSVSTDGSVGRVELKTSSGFPRLDQSTLEALKLWRFEPAMLGDQPIVIWRLVPFSCSLDGY